MEGYPRDGERLLSARTRVPAVRSPVVERRRLLDVVARGVQGPLTVVSGAAGAGKTVLVACWAAAGGAPGPVAWVTVDVEDDCPGTFWSYVLAALRRAGLPVPADVGDPFPAREVVPSLLTRLADFLATGETPVVLVLDQFDADRQARIWTELDFVLRHSADLLRLLVVTRDDELPALHRYELRGELTRIRDADLRFTTDETSGLLRRHGLELSAEQAATLHRHTGGWAAGLRLCAVALQQRGDPDDLLGALQRADAALGAYLVDEVLAGQAPEVRAFLLRTSVADELCASLADALTGRSDGGRMLGALRSGNVLTEEIDDVPGWYRYHPILVQALQEELRREHPAVVPRLHARAAVWFDGAGDLVGALRHAAAAGEWGLAAGTLVRRLGVGRLLAGRESGPLTGPLRDMPPGSPDAMVSVVRAALDLTNFDLEACHEHLGTAERLSSEVPDDDRAGLLAATAVVRVILARTRGDLPGARAALADGEAALARVPDLARAHPETAALLRSSAGTVELWSGHLADAERILRAGLAAAGTPGCEFPRLNMLGRLGMVEYLAGRSTAALELAQEELGLAERSGLPVDQRTGAGQLVLALVAGERGDRAVARGHLDDAERSVGARHDPLVATLVPLLRARQHADARDMRRASSALRRVPTEVGGRPLPEWLADRVRSATAAIMLERGDVAAAAAALSGMRSRGVSWSVGRASVAAATGDRTQARALLEPALSAEAGDAEADQVEAWLLAAHLHQEERDVAAARDAVRRALVLARPERRRRPFLRADARRRHLLLALPGAFEGHAWLGPPFADPAMGVEPGGYAPPLPAPVESLTGRELTVLGRMAAAMSAEDIAEDLFLSVNTIKTHQRSIYRKLGVSRRNDAVRRARALGLVPPTPTITPGA